MLTDDVRFEGFTSEEWCALGRVLFTRRDAAANGAPSGGVIVVGDATRLLKLVHTVSGRLSPADVAWPTPLSELCRLKDARWGIELKPGALDEAMDRFGLRLVQEQSYLEQSFELWHVLCDLSSEGLLATWPKPLHQLPRVTAPVAERVFDALCPDGRALLLGAFEAGSLVTCVAARRRGPGFDRIVGPELLRPEMGLLSGDWRRDYLHLARAAELFVGPLALGCFSTVDTFERLGRCDKPGAWAAAVAVRDVIVSPATPGVAIPLGIDVGRAALAGLRQLTGQLRAMGIWDAGRWIEPARARLSRWAGGDDELERLLGTDPLELLAKLRDLLRGRFGR